MDYPLISALLKKMKIFRRNAWGKKIVEFVVRTFSMRPFYRPKSPPPVDKRRKVFPERLRAQEWANPNFNELKMASQIKNQHFHWHKIWVVFYQKSRMAGGRRTAARNSWCTVPARRRTPSCPRRWSGGWRMGLVRNRREGNWSELLLSNKFIEVGFATLRERGVEELYSDIFEWSDIPDTPSPRISLATPTLFICRRNLRNANVIKSNLKLSLSDTMLCSCLLLFFFFCDQMISVCSFGNCNQTGTMNATSKNLGKKKMIQWLQIGREIYSATHLQQTNKNSGKFLTLNVTLLRKGQKEKDAVYAVYKVSRYMYCIYTYILYYIIYYI